MKLFAYLNSFCICIIKCYLVTTADMTEIFDREALKDFVTAYIKSEKFVNKDRYNYCYTHHLLLTL